MQTLEPTPNDLWHKNDTLQLIKIMVDLKSSCDNEKFNSNILYMQVANKLFERGYSRTYIQCKNKWKDLIMLYQKYKKSQTGEAPPFYSDLDKVLSNMTDFSEDSQNVTECMNKFGPPWSQYETSFLIKALRIGNFIYKLKTDEPSAVYEEITQYMQRVGSVSRTKEDIQQRWRSLKHSYIKYIKGELLHFKYFESMDALLDWEPNSVAFEEDQFKDGHEYEDEVYENPDDFESKSMPTSKRSLNWTHLETEKLLDIIQKYDIKRMKRESVTAIFDEASIQLRLQGFKRSAEQCRVKFKHLKVKYFSTLRRIMEGDNHPAHYFFHFDRMKEIMHSSTSENSNDTENGELSQDSEHYEIEYLEEEESETFEKVFLKEQIHTSPSSYSPQSSKKSRMVWSHAETQHLLNILKAKNVKRYCRKPIFEEVAYEMERVGFNRSAQMCMIKWKNLRNQLYACIRNLADGKHETCPFYNEICEIVENNGSIDLSVSDQDQMEFDENDDYNITEDMTDHKFTEGIDMSLNSSKFPKEINFTTNDKKRSNSTGEDSPKHLNNSKRFKNAETETNSDFDISRLTCNYKMDDTEHYCISLATTFKRLSDRKQAKLKIEIQKLLYTAEFDENF